MEPNTNKIFTPFGISKGEIPVRIQLLPSGTKLEGRDGRKWFIKDVHELIRRSNENIANHCIDENHAVDLKGKHGEQSPAFGWFKNITLESNGEVWADVEWTEKGIKALESKEYRYLSPVFISDKSNNITQILRAGLTNSPNIDMVSLNSERQTSNSSILQRIGEILGLDSDCTFEDILDAIAELKTDSSQRNSFDISKLEELVLSVETQKKNLAAEYREREAHFVVNTAVSNGFITPANRDKFITLCSTEDGLETVKEIIKNLPSFFDKTQIEGTPPGKVNINFSSEDEQFASSAGYTPEQWRQLKDFTSDK